MVVLSIFLFNGNLGLHVCADVADRTHGYRECRPPPPVDDAPLLSSVPVTTKVEPIAETERARFHR